MRSGYLPPPSSGSLRQIVDHRQQFYLPRSPWSYVGLSAHRSEGALNRIGDANMAAGQRWVVIEAQKELPRPRYRRYPAWTLFSSRFPGLMAKLMLRNDHDHCISHAAHHSSEVIE